jgi:hypothetical protein
MFTTSEHGQGWAEDPAKGALTCAGGWYICAGWVCCMFTFKAKRDHQSHELVAQFQEQKAGSVQVSVQHAPAARPPSTTDHCSYRLDDGLAVDSHEFSWGIAMNFCAVPDRADDAPSKTWSHWTILVSHGTSPGSEIGMQPVPIGMLSAETSTPIRPPMVTRRSLAFSTSLQHYVDGGTESAGSAETAPAKARVAGMRIVESTDSCAEAGGGARWAGSLLPELFKRSERVRLHSAEKWVHATQQCCSRVSGALPRAVRHLEVGCATRLSQLVARQPQLLPQPTASTCIAKATGVRAR